MEQPQVRYCNSSDFLMFRSCLSMKLSPSRTPLEKLTSPLHPAASTLQHRGRYAWQKHPPPNPPVNSAETASHWSGSILDSIGLWQLSDREGQLRIYCKRMLLLWVIDFRSTGDKRLKTHCKMCLLYIEWRYANTVKRQIWLFHKTVFKTSFSLRIYHEVIIALINRI